MKVLVIVAHPDDEVLGMGGTIKKHCSEKGLTGYTKLNKAGLVNLLENN